MFVPKVNTQENRDRQIFLEAFFPSPRSTREENWHKICPVRALRYYLHKSQEVRKPGCNRLFVASVGRRTGEEVTIATISSWLRATIQRAYIHMGREPPKVKAHSTRGMATSIALWRGASVSDICSAATWASDHVFGKHYKLDALPLDAQSISSRVLHSVVK